jgi:hypothetical protein
MGIHAIGSRGLGAEDQGPACQPSARQHRGTQVTKSLRKRVFTLNFFKLVALKLYIMIFIDFFSSCERFWSFLEDLEPFFRPNIGEKLGNCYPLQVYIN